MAFQVVLQAIYGWPVSLGSTAQLCLETELANYQIALGSLSIACYAVFSRSLDLCRDILGDEIELLSVAIKLTNEVLYREFMTMLIGP